MEQEGCSWNSIQGSSPRGDIVLSLPDEEPAIRRTLRGRAFWAKGMVCAKVLRQTGGCSY